MVLTPYLPHRRVGHGGGVAVRDLVGWLARRHEVLVASLVRPGEQDLTHEVEELGVGVVPLPFGDRRARGAGRAVLAARRAAALAAALGTGYPYYVRKYWSAGTARRIREAVRAFAPAAIQIEYLQMGLYCRDLRRMRGSDPAPRLILNSHELGSVPRERHAALAPNPATGALHRWEARAWRRYQVDATSWADHTLCVTPEDHALYAAMGGRNLVTMPLGMDTEAITPDRAPATGPLLLFVGSFQHRPNRSAVAFLLDRVWPRVRAALPAARLVIAGRGSDAFVAGREGGVPEGVQALGFVDDLGPLFRTATLFVAPLTEGGGIKIKILEAMARGLPVVTSPVGAEGITDDARLLKVAPCDASFAEAVLDLAADPDRLHAQARAARLLIEDRFSWRAITERLSALYAGEPPSPG